MRSSSFTSAAGDAEELPAADGDEFVKAGYLSKRNKRGKWKKRWIVLTPTNLLFYNDSDEASKKDSVRINVGFPLSVMNNTI